MSGQICAPTSRWCERLSLGAIPDTPERAADGVRVRVQQTALAHETVPHLVSSLASSSVAVQLTSCYVVEALQRNAATRRALDRRDVVTKLVELNQRQHALSAAPAIRCVGLLCELSRDNADAVVRANGLHTMLSTLEDDCPAQVRARAVHAALCPRNNRPGNGVRVRGAVGGPRHTRMRTRGCALRRVGW